MSNFPAYVRGQVITSTNTSAAHSLQSEAVLVADDVMIYNPGPYLVYVFAGGASAVADATCMPILPGEKGAYDKGGETHLAVFSPSGNQDITVFVGEGS